MAAQGKEFFFTSSAPITAHGSHLKNYVTFLTGLTLEHVALKSFQAAVQKTKS